MRPFVFGVGHPQHGKKNAAFFLSLLLSASGHTHNLYGSASSHLDFSAYQLGDLRLSYLPPNNDGGEPITKYKVEWDASNNNNAPTFSPSSQYFGSEEVTYVREEQEIVLSCPTTCSGTFALSWGGRVSVPLNVDATSDDVEMAINDLVEPLFNLQTAARGESTPSSSLVRVTRKANVFGYKWRVLFAEISGDVGSILADDDLLIGNGAGVRVLEIISGSSDLYPGAYTNEVQTVSVRKQSGFNCESLGGAFSLGFEGKTTSPISVNASAEDFKNALETLDTIHTVNVYPDHHDSVGPGDCALRSWIVTFTHLVHENRQGAGDLGFLSLFSSSLVDPTVTRVDIFENIKGTNPRIFNLRGLEYGLTYHCRVSAYNSLGYGVSSSLVSATPVIQPLPPTNVNLSIPDTDAYDEEGTSLLLNWDAVDDVDNNGGDPVSQYKIEWYSSVDNHEIQKLTTSSSDGITEIQSIKISADSDGITGYFRLVFNGETSDLIPHDADADGEGSLEVKLERLSTIGDVEVSRELSWTSIPDVEFSLTSGSNVLPIVGGSASVDSILSIGDPVKVGGEQHVVSSIDSSFITLSDAYTGPSANNVLIYRWSYGYEWFVTFNSHIGEQSLIEAQPADNWAGTNPVIEVSRVRKGVKPLSGTMRLGFEGERTRPIPFDADATLVKQALELLTTIGEVDVTRYTNNNGHNYFVTFLSELGDREQITVDDSLLMGPDARARVATIVDGTEPSDYGHAYVEDHSSSVIETSSLQYQIKGLRNGVPYYVRIRSRNTKGFGYARLVSSTPIAPIRPPSPPKLISLFPLSDTLVRVVWEAPEDSGGSSIEKYALQWDTDPSFASGHFREVFVGANDTEDTTTRYCDDFSIIHPSSSEQYARVLSFNGYKWSDSTESVISSTTPIIGKPGPVLDFNVFPTSKLGMMMTWNPPNPNIEDANNSCGYAGDGGSPITNYMIEYDSEADFASPAISVIVPSNEFSYRIGGRDVLTGSESPVLEVGGTYYVRITAFNAQGSGTTVTFPEAVGPLGDTAPGTPSVLNAVPLSASSVKVEWGTPSLDGGSVLQEYIVEYDTVSDFDIAPKNISTPVVSEVKGIQVGLADLNLNTQTIEATVAVTNEVQSIRTEIVGVDEIQEITTTCDDVVAEVQMIVTNAVDTNEEQVLSLMSDDIDEIQLVRLHGNDQVEVQSVQVSVERVNEVQRLGIVISNINTDGDGVHSTACIGNDVGEPCAEIEAALGGSFTVSFDFDECGGDGGVNYCQLALSKYEPSLGTVVCSPGLVLDPYAGGDHCVSGPVSYSSSSVEGEMGTLQYAINNLVDDNGVSFMTLPNVPGKKGGVTVTREGRIKTKGSCALQDGSCSGEYEVLYEILFDSVHTSGDVPPVTVVASDFRVDTTSSSYLNTMCPSDYYVNGCETPVGSAASSEYGSFYDSEAGSVAFESMKGTQPSGMISLDYECESRVTNLPVGFSMTIFNGGMSASFDADDFVVGMSIGQLIRFSSGDGIDFYRKISGIDVDTNSVQLATRAPTDGVSYQDVEFGDYFSDYDGSNGDLGVSSYCMASRIHTTLSLDVDIYNEANSVVDWKGKIGALPVIEASGVSVSRDIVSDLSTEVGLRWEVTFLKQPGHVNQMSCNHVSGTNECSVETTQDSSLIDGNFRLQTTWPHEYVSESIEMYETTTLRWNADANDVKNALESVTDLDGNKVFGLVSVTRSPYVASTHLRWSGGYQWVITFLSRGGNIPAMTSDDSAITGMDVVLEISDEDSGVSDLFQGIRNSASFGTDDPGLARDGNQVSGSFALFWNGNTYHDSVETSEVFNIQTGGLSTDQFTALTAEGFKALFEEYVLGGDSDGQKVDVTRSELPTQWMGFSYTIVFRHEDVGGDVPPLIHKQGSSLHGRNSYVHISESIKGTEIAGTFQLRFEGETTRAINYDATALDVQEALNELNSIAPSAVVVSGGDNPVRSGPSDGNAGMSTQVGGRIWYVTFASNTWRDPTVSHDASFIPGNWVGPPASYSDTWNSGFSKGWGKNVGNVPIMSCLSSGLTTTNGAVPTDGCSVHELVPGTDPLGGVFKVCLDSATSPNGIMSVESKSCTDFIAHNAVASAYESGGDGSSMEEKLEQLDNIGHVHVTRSAINTRNGGYTWKVTFLHDADGPCEQKDDIHNMCNSPGDVPKLCSDLSACDTSSLLGTCLSPNTCHKLGVLDQGDKEDGRRFPGGNEKQVVLVKDTNYLGWKDGSIISSEESKEFKLIVGGVETSCIPNNASADDMRMAIQTALDNAGGIGGSVRVHRVRTEDLAENGYAFYLTFYDTGDIDLLGALYSSTSCPHNFEPTQSVVVSHILDGSLHPSNCNECADGIVQRGKFTTFEVHGDNLGGDLAWNANPSDVKAHLEQVSSRTVIASRSVLDKYGTIEWTITFTENAESIPPGSGDIQELVVAQDQDTSNRDAEILINEIVKGSEGLHGTFDLDYASFDGARTFSYDETSVDMMQKLENMSTIGSVFVTKDCFPSCTTGGWGGSAVAPGTVGGYKWVVHFLRNPGSDKGITFPPGSGFISPPSIDDTSLLGDDASVTMNSPMDGSAPLLGTFNLVINGETTAPIPYNADASALEQSINDLQSVGDVTVTSGMQALLPIPGVYANIITDSNVASIVGGDLRENFAPGDMFRIGGSATEIDGAELVGTTSLTPFSPILMNAQLNDARKHIHVGETVRVGGETYTVVKNGIEVQLIAVHRSSDIVSNGNFYQLQVTINGATEVTSCLSFDASAMDVETALNDALSSLSNNGGVLVTRTSDTSDYAGDAHLYKVYFVGDRLIGDVDEMIVESCSDGIPAGIDSTNSHVHVRTLVQGGRTEHQRITLSSDAGSTSEIPAVRLSIMDSNSNSWESPCFVWGASSLDLATAIDADVFSSALLTVGSGGVTAVADNQYKIEASTFVEGIILVGDVVNPGKRCPGRVISIGDDGKSILIESASGCETSAGDDLFVNSDITIIESSTNNSYSTSEITLLEIYSDGEITSNDVGLYKLTVDLGGISRNTECLPFGASAEDMKEQVGLLFDYNQDGVIDDLDKDHISIVRDGDGSSSSGFGYTYKIISSGSRSTFGSSATLGSNAPSFFVAHIGADGGCEDYGSNDVLLTSTASTTDENNVVLLDPGTTTNIVAGTRFRASSSLDPSKIYTVDHIQADNMAVILTEPFYGSTVAGSVLIHLVHGGVPQFNVVVLQEGVDEYVYDLFFTGSHWSDVPQVHVNTFGDGTCSASNADMIGGMNRNIGVKTIVDGGGTIDSVADTYVVDRVARYDQVGVHNLYEVPPTLSILDMGSITPQFTSNQLPFGRGDRWIGESRFNLPVYRVSGTYWLVRFGQTLGNVSQISIDSNSLPPNAQASVTNVLGGVNPDHVTIPHLSTGIPYYFRVYARNSNLAFSSHSDVVSAVPSGKPEVMSMVSSNNALHRNEIQEVILAASHRNEVQTITTSAIPIPEVQEITLEGTEDSDMNSYFFSLRHPEIQVVKLSAGSPVTSGSFFLKLRYVDIMQSNLLGSLVYKEMKSSCIPYNASAEEVKRAIEIDALADPLGSNSVRVVRSGSRTYSSDYGYVYKISFEGSNVRGNMPEISSDDFELTGLDSIGGTSCDPFVTSTNDASLEIWTENESFALGTDTPRAELIIDANIPIVEGEYQLSVTHFGQQVMTPCIPWNAGPSELELALKSLTNIDSVRVDSTGTGILSDNGAQINLKDYPFEVAGPNSFSAFEDISGILFQGDIVRFSNQMDSTAFYEVISASGNTFVIDRSFEGLDNDVTTYQVTRYFGKRHIVYFDGNAMHTTGADAIGFVPLQGGNFNVVEPNSCNPPKSYHNNVLKQVSEIPGGKAGVRVISKYDGKHTLPGALSTESSTVIRDTLLAALPMRIGEAQVTQSLETSSNGLTFTITYGNDDGNIPLLVCNQSLASMVSCHTGTVMDANEIRGNFYLESSDPIPYDATPSEMESAISSISGVGSVDVTRTLAADGQGGFTWNVTFTGSHGDVPLLRASNSLTGKGAMVRPEIQRITTSVPPSSSLSGFFIVSFSPYGTFTSHSTNIAFDATAEDFKTALESIEGIGTLEVSRQDCDNPSITCTWDVTFASFVGEVNLLEPDYSRLMIN